MARYYGKIGFFTMTETSPGVWKPQSTERYYYCDLIQNTSRFQASGGVNDNITISNIVSVMADPYAKENFSHIRYAEFMGTNWKVEKAEVKYPRLLLTLGGVYNGEQA